MKRVLGPRQTRRAAGAAQRATPQLAAARLGGPASRAAARTAVWNVAAAWSLLMVFAVAGPPQSKAARGLPPRARSLIAQLGSPSLATRADVLARIKGSAALLRNLAVGRAMAGVLSADTDPLSRSSRVWKGPYGEGWAEFDAELLGVLQRNYGFRDPVIAQAMARAPYLPQSAFARAVATQGAALLPDLLVLLKEGVPVVRSRVIGVFGFMLAGQREGKLLHSLSPAEERFVKRSVLKAARAPDYVVRCAAVQSLGVGGDRGDIPLLRRIAARDPGCAEAPRVNICAQADRAIATILKRAGRARRSVPGVQKGRARRQSAHGPGFCLAGSERRSATVAPGRGQPPAAAQSRK